MEGLSALFKATTAAANRDDVERLVREHWDKQPHQPVALVDVLGAVGLHVLPEAVVTAEARQQVTFEWVVQVAIMLQTQPPLPPQDESEQPQKKSKEFDIDEFMTKLHDLCAPPAADEVADDDGAVVPLAQQAQPDAATLLAMCTTLLVQSPRAHFRCLLLLGYYVRSITHLNGGDWTKVSAALGLRKAHARSNVHVKRALVVYHELLLMGDMFKLRHLRPDKKGTVLTLEKHKDDILDYLKAHPDELSWWNDDEQDPPVVRVRNHKGHEVDWLDWRWLWGNK